MKQWTVNVATHQTHQKSSTTVLTSLKEPGKWHSSFSLYHFFQSRKKPFKMLEIKSLAILVWFMASFQMFAFIKCVVLATFNLTMNRDWSLNGRHVRYGVKWKQIYSSHQFVTTVILAFLVQLLWKNGYIKQHLKTGMIIQYNLKYVRILIRKYLQDIRHLLIIIKWEAVNGLTI